MSPAGNRVLSRRRLLTACAGLPLLPQLGGCTSPLPAFSTSDTEPAAAALLAQSAAAHGSAAFAGLSDVNVSYAGRWHRLVSRLQPALVDAGFRGGSQERILAGGACVAQAHQGPSGAKQVLRHTAPGGPGDVRVWFNGEESEDAERRAAAALVVDGYTLFLLGPLVLEGLWRLQRGAVVALTGVSEVAQDGRTWRCDVLSVRIRPGLGLSAEDRLALFIDRETHLMRRVRFTLDGLESTRGAIAEVDTWNHVELHGVRWPTRFHEHLRRPFPLAVHDWSLTGLDVNRGLAPAEVGTPSFRGAAAVPAGAVG